MKPTSFFYITALVAYLSMVLPNTRCQAQYNARFFGASAKNDVCNKLIRTSDGGYLMAGIVDNDAALYKFDCAGNLLDSLRKDLAVANSFETFNDVLELPNGEFLAVGHVLVPFVYGGALAIRVSSDLKELAFDTFTVLGKAGELRNLVRTKNGQVYVSGIIDGTGFNLGDNFCASFNPAKLVVTDSVTVFNYGILEEPTSLLETADGNFLMTGAGVTGDITTPEALVQHRAFARKFKPDGVKLWDFTRDATFKSKYGRATMAGASETLPGNILIAGNAFTGDTTADNILDVRFTLLSPDGKVLDENTVVKPGSQRLYQIIRTTLLGGNLLVAVGDSTANLRQGFASPFSAILGESAQKIVVVNAGADPSSPLSIHSIVEVPTERLAFAGVLYNPAESKTVNEDIFLATPGIGVLLSLSGSKATVTEPIGAGYSYQWYTAAGAIPDATNPSYTAQTSGTYAVIVTDAQGCTGIAVTVLTIPLQAVVEITQPIFCAGGATGEIDITPLGGIPPFKYSLNGGPLQDNNTYSGLKAGDYTVVVVDAQGTTFSPSILTLSDPPKIVVSPVVNQSNVTVSASGGVPPFKYSVDNQPFVNGNTFANLPNGLHTFTVKDANGCTATASATVNVVSAASEIKETWSVSVSPNPGDGLFHLIAHNLSDVLQAELYDPSGHFLSRFEWGVSAAGKIETNIDIKNQPAGVYMLRLFDGQHEGAVKLLKNR